MQTSQPNSHLARFFAGVAEYIFHSQLGVADPPLVEYVSDLLCRFVRFDAIYKIRNIEGRPLSEVVDMVAEAENRIGEARREVHRHIGDFALFWVGVYPETLEKMRSPAKKDYFVDYCNQGKHAYLVASSIETDREQDTPSELLERLSHEFEMCAYGLRRVREQWEMEARDGDGPCPLLIN